MLEELMNQAYLKDMDRCMIGVINVDETFTKLFKLIDTNVFDLEGEICTQISTHLNNSEFVDAKRKLF